MDRACTIVRAARFIPVLVLAQIVGCTRTGPDPAKYVPIGKTNGVTPVARSEQPDRTLLPSSITARSLPVLQSRLGAPLPGLTGAQLARFQSGKVAFSRIMYADDGLGPIHNLHSCIGCHSNPTGGSGSNSITMFGKVTDGVFDPLLQLGGPSLQAEALDPVCAEEIPPEANVVVHRITSSILGAGLIEAIPAEAIKAFADNPPEGINGRVSWVSGVEDGPGARSRVGRFGFKSQIATLLTFSALAARNELGLTNRFFPEENAPNGNPARAIPCDNLPDPEIRPDADGQDFVTRITDFQRYLAPPSQTPRSGMIGEAIFTRIGCAGCHVPSFTTGDNATLEEPLRRRVIKPYSDFLLHDMGESGDGIAQGDAGTRDMRTTPLWGFRIRFPVFHDGRITGATLAERAFGTIELHRGEAGPSLEKFRSLPANERNEVIAFLDSLGRVEFDHDGDNDVDLADVCWFRQCFSDSSLRGYSPEDRCSLADIDQDGKVDLADYALLQRAITGPDYGSALVVP